MYEVGSPDIRSRFGTWMGHITIQGHLLLLVNCFRSQSILCAQMKTFSSSVSMGRQTDPSLQPVQPQYVPRVRLFKQ